MVSVAGVTADGTSYGLSGPKDAPVLVLIHGLGLCREVFSNMVPALSNYRVLSYDLYGHGASQPPREPASLSTYADQLAQLMDHLDIAAAHVIGFSIGGMINRRFALDYPDRVLSLFILNSPHDRGEVAQAQVEARAKLVRDEGVYSTLPAALQRWFTPDYLAAGDGPARVTNWRGQVDPESYAQAAWVLAHGVRELTGRTGQIRVPSFVLTCENDTGSTPKMSHDIAAEIAGAEVLIVPILQHLGLMEDPKTFTKPILEFLERFCDA